MSRNSVPELRPYLTDTFALIILAYSGCGITLIAGSFIAFTVLFEQQQLIPPVMIIAASLIAAITLTLLVLLEVKPKT